jgi:hypothetical protein
MKGLALCLVDGHGKAESKRQLAAEQFEGEIILGGGTINPRDEMHVAVIISPIDSCHNASLKQLGDDQAGAVAESMLGVEVAQQHDRRSFSET